MKRTVKTARNMETIPPTVDTVGCMMLLMENIVSSRLQKIIERKKSRSPP